MSSSNQGLRCSIYSFPIDQQIEEDRERAKGKEIRPWRRESPLLMWDAEKSRVYSN